MSAAIRDRHPHGLAAALLAARVPVGANVVLTAPRPAVVGTVVEHVQRGVMIRRPDGGNTFLAWSLVGDAAMAVRTAVTA